MKYICVPPAPCGQQKRIKIPCGDPASRASPLILGLWCERAEVCLEPRRHPSSVSGNGRSHVNSAVRQAELTSKPAHSNQIVQTCSYFCSARIQTQIFFTYLRIINATCVRVWGVANQCQLHAGRCQDSRIGKSRKRSSATAEPDECLCIPRVTGPRGISCSQRLDGKRSSGQVGCFSHHPGPSASFDATS